MAGSAEDHVKYLLAAMCHTHEFKVDYHALAAHCNISSANNSQKRFKAIVEKSGEYQLLNGRVLAIGGSPSAAPATPTSSKATSTPASSAKKRKATSTLTPKTKKRRVTQSKGHANIKTISDLKEGKTDSKDAPEDEKDDDWVDDEGEANADEDNVEQA